MWIDLDEPRPRRVNAQVVLSPKIFPVLPENHTFHPNGIKLVENSFLIVG
jgi:hypothetical protein